MKTGYFPHRRHNPLEDKWVLVSPQRLQRPWLGQTEKAEEYPLPEYDPACYLCPRNKRAGGCVNPDYKQVYHFVNDYSAILPHSSPATKTKIDFFSQEGEQGICEVLCYSPCHNKAMSLMAQSEIKFIIALWKERYLALSKKPFINHVQIFENRGNEVGNSNLHPHGQIWAQEHIPNLALKEISCQTDYFRLNNKTLLLDYLKKELSAKDRLVYQNPDFAIVVPYWAEWPFESLVLPKSSLSALDGLSEQKAASLAQTLSIITKAYDKLFNRQRKGAPYTIGIHQRPTDGKEYRGIQMHLHFHPPLLTTVRQKFMVGYERFAEPQRDLTAEQAAKKLKSIICRLA